MVEKTSSTTLVTSPPGLKQQSDSVHVPLLQLYMSCASRFVVPSGHVPVKLEQVGCWQHSDSVHVPLQQNASPPRMPSAPQSPVKLEHVVKHTTC